MKKAILHSIYGGALAVTAGAAVAVPLVVVKVATKKTKDILAKIVPLDGPNNSIYERLNDGADTHAAHKLNYLALGDTISAGANNQLSFADFLAADFNKNGILNDYRNFAAEGDRIPEQRSRIFRDPAAMKAVKKADVITITLGGNDLLAAVEILNLSFNVLRGKTQLDMIGEVNTARDGLAAVLQKIEQRAATPAAYASDNDAATLIRESIVKLEGILKNGTLSGVLDIEQELLDKIFDMIKLDLSTFIAEIHGGNPNAKIIVLGYPYPFNQLPQSMQNDPIVVQDAIKDQMTGEIKGYEQKTRMLDGKPATLKGIFNKFVDTLHETVERANYVKFFNVNDMPEFKDAALDQMMPTPLGLHPSLRGAQNIANHIFEWVAQDGRLPNQTPYVDADHPTEALHKIYTLIGDTISLDGKTYQITEQSPATDHGILNALAEKITPELLKNLGVILETILPQETANTIFTGDVAKVLLGAIKKPEKLMLLLNDLVTPDEMKTTLAQLLAEVESNNDVATKIANVQSLLPNFFKNEGGDTGPRGRIKLLLEMLPSLDLSKVLKNLDGLLDAMTDPTKSGDEKVAAASAILATCMPDA